MTSPTQHAGTAAALADAAKPNANVAALEKALRLLQPHLAAERSMDPGRELAVAKEALASIVSEARKVAASRWYEVLTGDDGAKTLVARTIEQVSRAVDMHYGADESLELRYFTEAGELRPVVLAPVARYNTTDEEAGTIWGERKLLVDGRHLGTAYLTDM